MTTIVADTRTGVLVADRRLDTPCGAIECVKIYRLDKGPWAGYLFGGSGHLSTTEETRIRLLEDRLTDGPVELNEGELEEDFEILLLGPKGLFYVDRWLRAVQLHAEYYAGGSGCHFAIGAMDAGASAIRAVKIACERDAHSGLMGKKPLVLRL